MTDYPDKIRDRILAALDRRAMSTSDLARCSGDRLIWILLALRDLQAADRVRLTTAGRYRRMR